MTKVDSTAPAEVGAITDPINDLFYESAHYWGRMNAFFELVERDIKEQNSCDLDTIAFLVIGAKAEFDRFSKLISKVGQHLEEKRSASGSPAESDKAEESRAGAMAGMNALRAIERITGGDLSGMSMEAWWGMQDECVAAMCNAAGNPSTFTTGFISTFAEYVLTINTGGIPNLDKWKPDATMAKEEKATHRAALIKRVEEDEKIAA